MIIEKSPRFKDEFEAIIDFIAKDSVNRALAFYDELLVKINQIPNNPICTEKDIDSMMKM